MTRAKMAVDEHAVSPQPHQQGGVIGRLVSRKAAAMLWRNTVVSCLLFAISIGLLWLLVEFAAMAEVWAAAIGFVVASTLHYALGRVWIFAGTDRAVASGYAYFLATCGLGLVVTMVLYAALLRFTSIDYLAARVLVSVAAGLIMFALNAVLTFRKL